MNLSKELQVALQAAELASKYLRVEYAAFVPIPDAPASISTHADRASQEMILQHLHAAFPQDAFVAEETTDSLLQSPVNLVRQWIVDPIDGTRGFAVKNGEFSVMIGLALSGRPVVGVVWEPMLNRLTYAAQGEGCWAKDADGIARRCEVSACEDLALARLTQSHSKPGSPPKRAEALLLPKQVMATYSAGIKLAQVARGEADVYVSDHPEFYDWDVCAGEILVLEAGGTVTECTGETIRYSQLTGKPRRGLLASNGRIHAEAVLRLSAT